MAVDHHIHGSSPPGLPPRSRHAERELRSNTLLRQARTCYGHLAGAAGVALFARILDLGWMELAPPVESPRPDYRLTEIGVAAMKERGLDIASIQKAKRRFAYGCTDWTERKHHLGGALGAAILVSLVDLSYVSRRPETRVVNVAKDPATWAAYGSNITRVP